MPIADKIQHYWYNNNSTSSITIIILFYRHCFCHLQVDPGVLRIELQSILYTSIIILFLYYLAKKKTETIHHFSQSAFFFFIGRGVISVRIEPNKVFFFVSKRKLDNNRLGAVARRSNRQLLITLRPYLFSSSRHYFSVTRTPTVYRTLLVYQ